MFGKLQQEPVVLFATKPELGNLCAVTVRTEHNLAGTTTQPRILKCRETIFTEPDVIASPSADLFDCFNVIMPQTLYKSGHIQTRMKNSQCQARASFDTRFLQEPCVKRRFRKSSCVKRRLKPVQVSKPFRASPALYQSCLRYTLLARLAPLWNKAGDWIIRGRDFLSHTGTANAVQLQLVVNPDELYISVRATLLRLVPLQVQSLLYNAANQSGEVAVHNHWCHVLPSMKKGRLLSVSLSIPADSPFASYRDLKRHWKNTYGYRLPETDDDIFFGQISFWGAGGKQFTYPSVCLREGPFQCVPRVESRPILSAFLQDLHAKLPSVCGQTIRFQPQVRHTCPALYSASQDVPGLGLNLSKRSTTASSAPPLRRPQSISQLSQSAPSSSDVAKMRSSAASLKTPEFNPLSPRAPSTQMSGGQSGTKWVDTERQDSITSLQSSRDANAQALVFSSQSANNTWTPGTTREPGKHFITDGDRESAALLLPREDLVTDLSENGTDFQSQQNQTSSASQMTNRSCLRSTPVPGSATSSSSVLNRSDNSACQIQQSSSDNAFENGAREMSSVRFLEQAPSSHRDEGVCPVDRKITDQRVSSTTLNASTLVPQPEVCSTVNQPERPRFVPIFKPKTASSVSTAKSNVSKSQEVCAQTPGSSNRIVPIFKPKAVKASSANASRQATPVAQAKKDPPSFAGRGADTASRSRNGMEVESAEVVSCSRVSSSTEFGSSKGVFSTPVQPSFAKKLSLNKGMKSPSVKPAQVKTSNTGTPIAGKLKKKMLASSTQPCGLISPQPALTPQTGQTLLQSPMSTPGGSSQSTKRKGDGQTGGEEAKKARNKPQVQDIDVEMLAKTNQLNKANTVTLTAWLKSRGVHCKAKDKKGDLVDRVKVLLAMKNAET